LKEAKPRESPEEGFFRELKEAKPRESPEEGFFRVD